MITPEFGIHPDSLDLHVRIRICFQSGTSDGYTINRGYQYPPDLMSKQPAIRLTGNNKRLINHIDRKAMQKLKDII